MDNEVASLYEKSKDAVVSVHVELPSSLDRPSLGSSHRVGTGFFMDAEGRVLTVGTLIDGMESCWIDWHGQHVEAKLLSRDLITNLALLKVDPARINKKSGTTPNLPMGNSDDLRVGSMVVAIGFPYELPSAPVVGFVTGLDISCGKRVFPISYIRAGCQLSPGQGGGPLLNSHGEVVGIVMAARGNDHCYAMPIKAVKKVYDDILADGEPQHGWVGLNVTERQFTNEENGSVELQVFIREVFSNTPAALAGFRDQDVLLRICTNEMHRSADVLNTMFYHRTGERIPMAVMRGGVTQELFIVVGKRVAPVEQPIVQAAPLPPPTYPSENIGSLIVPTSATRP
jgi:serine protease Do